MVETSHYFPGTTIGDCGPYGAATMYQNLAQVGRAGNAESLAALYNMGVFYAVANQLEPTINGTDVDVDTGASLVDGAYHENDATVSVAITAAAGASRTDLIVVRKNFQTAVTYTPGGGAPTVGPQETRITVIRGPGATVTQDTTRLTYWDIPLATVDVNNAGVLSNLTDLREYVDAETKYLWVPALSGEETGTGTLTFVNTAGFGPRINLVNTAVTYANGHFRIPHDYISDMTARAFVFGGANGTVYTYTGYAIYAYGDTTGAPTASGNTGYAGTALVLNTIAGLQTLSVTGGSTGLYVGLLTSRDAPGSGGVDTMAASLPVFGWYVNYFGWKK